MGMHVLALPLLPGKTEAWRQFASQLEGVRKADFEASLKRQDALKERAFLQPSGSDGDTVVYILKGRPTIVRDVLHGIGTSADPFDRWFTQQMRELHGVDLAEPNALPDAKLIYKEKRVIAG